MFLNHANGLVDRLVGGWQLAGVVLFQSGPFLTVTAAGTDPSGTGFPTLFGNGRADVVPGVSLSPVSQSVSQWINPAAFAIPASNIGRFGTSPIGNLQGPGTQAVSLSLMKAVRFTEQLNFQIGAQVGNVFNHPNYAPPGTTLGTASFGTISNVQSAEGAGPRNIQITARLNF
jgi:hypothetical protein